MDRDYHIRIILTARDNVSQAINNIVINGNRNLVVLGNAFDKVGEHLGNLDKKVRNTGQEFNRNRSYIARFAEGLHQGGSRIRQFSSDLDNGRNRLGRFGFTITRTIRDVDRFINLRWFLVLGFLNVMGNSVAVLSTNLLALAASASKAAIALGGAFLAGIAQLLPVLGLLEATMLRLDKVMKAVDATDKARTNSAQDSIDSAKAQREAQERLTDAHYNLQQANEAAADSEYQLANARKDLIEALRDQARAEKALIEARRDAADNIVDKNNEEKDAALDLRDAELGVLEAKRKLREEEQKASLGNQDIEFARAQVRQAQEALKTAKAEGDQALISSGNQQLAFAEQNLNAIVNTAEQKTTDLKQAQLGVDQAQQRQREAEIRNKRAQRDANRTRAQGVEGSDEVISALDRVRSANRNVEQSQRAIITQTRALRDANRNVVVATRELRDAQIDAANAANKQSSSQQALKDALKDLSPAERGLVNAIDRFKRVAQREFGPIQDIIIRAFTRAVNAAKEVLLDPGIQRAARTLAKSIAGVIDSFTEFSKTDEFKDALQFFTNQAARNVPKLGAAFLDLLKIFIRVGRAATPIFNDLLDKVVKLISRIERGTRDPDKLRKFFAAAGEHLNDWIKLATAVGNLFGAFLFDTNAAGEGRKLLEDITDLFNQWADWIRENPELINKFFHDMREELGALAAVFGRLAILLFKTFTSDESAAFSKLILETFVPALGAFIKLIGAASKVLVALFDIPVVGDLAKWIVQFAIIYGLANRLFALIGITGKGAFAQLFKSLTDNNSRLRVFARSLRTPIQTAKELRDKFIELAAKGQAFANTLGTKMSKALSDAQIAAEKLRIKLRETADKLVELGKQGVNAAIRIGSRFRQAIIDTTISVGQFLKSIGTSAIATLRRFAAFLATQVVAALRILRLNIRLLVGATGIGLLLIAAALIIEHWDKVKAFLLKLVDAFQGFISWIRQNWKQIAVIIGAVLLGPAGAIFLIYKFRDKIKDAFKAIGDAIKNAFTAAIDWVKSKVTGLGDWLEKKIKKIPILNKFLGDSGPEKDIVNSVLNKVDAPQGIFNKILNSPELKAYKKRIAEARQAGQKPQDILADIYHSGAFTADELLDLFKKYGAQSKSGGGAVSGAYGQAVPAIVHAGEWVLNKMQQEKVSQRLGMTAEQASNFIFGTKGTSPARPYLGKAGFNTRSGKQGNKDSLVEKYADFDLRAQTDEYGVTVWFIEQADGTFGQVSKRDAARIQSSHGSWIPGYVKRSTHGYIQNIMERVAGFPNLNKRPKHGQRKFDLGGIVQAFANGGIVQPSYGLGGIGMPIQSFEDGGIVLNAGSGASAPHIGEFKQHFEVKAESPMDWNYIMRLSAIHAQGAF